MPIINIYDVRIEEFETGRTYQTLVRDDAGSTPVRIGIQGAVSLMRTSLRIDQKRGLHAAN